MQYEDQSLAIVMSRQVTSPNHTFFPGQAWLSSLTVLCVHTFHCDWQQPLLNQRKVENGRRYYFMINLQDSIRSSWDWTSNPWIYSQTPYWICCGAMRSVLWILKYELWTMKCEIWTMKCKVWIEKCEVWTVNFERLLYVVSHTWQWNMTYELWFMKCEVWSCSLNYEIWSAKY